MTKQEFKKFLDELEKIRKIVCKHEGNDCDHNRCMASINGCYGDECAFDAVIEAIEKLKRDSDGR
jgi:hypothetical protein